MKKSALLLCVLMSVISLGGMLCGCNKDEGKLYTLEQAYEQGWLNVEDLQQIADCWNGKTAVQNLDVLSEKSKESIKNAFKKKFNSQKKYPNITTDEVKIWSLVPMQIPHLYESKIAVFLVSSLPLFADSLS